MSPCSAPKQHLLEQALLIRAEADCPPWWSGEERSPGPLPYVSDACITSWHKTPLGQNGLFTKNFNEKISGIRKTIQK